MTDFSKTPRLPLNTTAVLFDLDDTLHYRSKAFRGWAEWFASTHFPENAEQQKALAAFLIELDAHGYTPRDTYFQRLREKYPALTLNPSIQELITEYQQEVIRHIQREIGLFELLQALKSANIPFGIVTNGRTTQQQRKIETLGLHTLTSCIFISEAFGAKKPDRSIFLAAAHCLNTPPEQILFVGDHPEYDIWGAQQVGMRTVWIQHELRHWHETTMRGIPDLTIQGLAELPRVFGLPPVQQHDIPLKG